MRISQNLHSLMSVFSVIALSALLCVAHAAMAPAGSMLENIAEIHYSDGVNDFVETTNPSRVMVAPTYGMQLTSDQTILRPSNATVNLPHRVRNTGNTPDDYTLSVVNLAGDDYEFTNLRIYRDHNENGIADSGEPIINSLSALPAGAEQAIVVAAYAPSGLTDGMSGQLQITVSSTNDVITSVQNTDTVTIISGAILEIDKASDFVCSTPIGVGDEIEYSIRLRSIGTVAPAAQNYQIQGVTRSGIVLQDRLPAELELIAGQTLSFTPITPNGIPVVRLATAAANEWVEYQNWNAVDAITSVGLFMPANFAQPGSVRSFAFKTRVKAGLTANTVINNQAGIDIDLDGSYEFVSANVCNTLQAPTIANLQLSKTANSSSGAILPSCNAIATSSQLLTPNSTITYTLALNGSPLAPADLVYQVDGNAENGLIVEDVIPANTSLNTGSLISSNTNATPVVQLAADVNSNNWITPANIGVSDLIAKVGLLVPRTEVDTFGESVTLSFKVQTASIVTQGTKIRNTANLDFDLNSANGFNVSSDSICHQLQASDGNGGTDNEPEIRFIRPDRSNVPYGTSPDFANANDFEDADRYFLDSIPFYTAQDNGVYLEVKSTSLNTTSYLGDGATGAIEVKLESRDTGDFVTVVVLETAPNSGIFRSIRPIVLSETKQGNGAVCPSSGSSITPNYTNADLPNCQLNSRNRDRLKATITDPGTSVELEANAGVDPLGVVFDSQTGQLIAGAVVSIRDSVTDALALHPNGSPLLPQTTGVDGFYQYPEVQPGNYYIQVIPPANYSGPSTVAIANMPAGFIVNQFSYGRDGFSGILNSGVFTLSIGDPPLFVDLPLDPPATINGARLLLEKGISQSSNTIVKMTEVELGDRIKYQLKVSNVGNADTPATVIKDILPFGFKYETGSARLNGNAMTPTVIGGGELQFSVGNLLAQAGAVIDSATVTYVLKVTAGAVDSDGINTAVASSGAVVSNTSQAQVKVLRDGLLSDRSILFGKVFIDATCDGIQNNREWPIGGVRLYMENGTHVTTDENGMYSLYGVTPGQHVIKVDRLTLPTGIKGIPTETRHGADPYSRFVDLYDGEFHRADFVFACPGDNAAAVVKQLEERHRAIAGDWLLDEAVKFNGDVQLQQNQSGQRARRSVTPAHDGDTSSGQVGSKRTIACCENQLVDEDVEVDGAVAYPHSETSQRKMPLTEEAVDHITRKMGRKGTWLWPKDDLTYGGRLMVVVRAGVKPTLVINDEVVGADRLGEHIVNKKEQAQIMAWYGLPMKVGNNTVKVLTKDMFGNERVMAERILYHPGTAKTLKLMVDTKSVPADNGRSSIPVRIKALDENGKLAKGTFYATLEAEHGQWLEKDIQDKTQGFQVKLVNGEALVHLRSSDYVGEVNVRASLNDLQQDQTVDFLPVLRPMLAVGLIDIGGHISNVSKGMIEPSKQKDGYADKLEMDGRAAIFLKGKVKGDMLLTLSYDTDKDNEELFRDIDPNEYYPIYGDSSVRGFDAQSQSKLYVKLEKNKSSIMWGDYETDTNLHNKSSLGRVTESLTGLNAHYEKESKLGKTQVNVFAAEKDRMTQFEQIPGRGTATGYRLQNFPVEPNSERITIVTIDRENTQPSTANGFVISERVLERYRDYEVNHLNGFITFYEVIPTFDDQGNNVYIRVNYESQQVVDSYAVAGARISQQLGNGFTVGASVSKDDSETEGYEMGSAYVEFEPSSKHKVIVEAATRDNEGGNGKGDAALLEWKSKWSKRLETEVKLGTADQGFKNHNAPIASGRDEARAKARVGLSESTTLEAEVIRSGSNVSANKDQRDVVAASLSQRLGKWNVSAGVKHTEQERTSGSDEYDSLTAKVERGFSLNNRNGKFYVEGERSITSEDRQRIAAGSEYQLQEKISMYVRAEQIDSSSNISSLNSNERKVNASLGLKSDWLPSTQMYSEYRMESAIDGRDLVAVNGVRGAYEIKPKLKFSPSLEIIDTLEGDDASDAYSVSVSLVDSRNKNLRQAIRAETRQSESNDYYSLDYSYAARINLDWSSLYRNQYTLDEPKNNERRLSNTLTLGMARRPLRNNKWHSLYLLQWKEERNVNEDERRAYILSTHQNYQFRRDLTLAGRAAAKLQTQHIDDVKYDSTAQLLGARFIWGLNKRWDIDFRAGLLSSELGEDLRYSFGMGGHYLINRNLRFGLGFNFVGFDDSDLDSQKYHAEGMYFGLQYKFDESLFEWLR